MSVAKKIKTVSTYVLLGCPIGTLSLLLVFLLKEPGIPSYSEIVDALKILLAGYIVGFIPAVSSGVAHLYAQAHAFSRKQIVGFVSAVGVLASVISFGAGFPSMWAKPPTIALLAVTGLIPSVVISSLLTRSSIRDTT
jgi:hypothetical protein